MTTSLLTACGQTKKLSLVGKISIDVGRVDRIRTSKHKIPTDTTKLTL